MNKFKDKLILIIDDNPMNLAMASFILEDFGFNTCTAESGEAGIAELENELPALILLDVEMPDMNGYDVCRKIKEVEAWKEIPIIFLTGKKETENVVEGFEAGGVDYIGKPFEKDELKVRVDNHIEIAELRKTVLNMNSSRDKLYSIIAHDIRSPLSGILQTIDAIDQGYFDPSSEDFKEMMSHLKTRTKDTFTLLTSLLQWTRFQDEKVLTQPKQTDLFVVLNSCVQLLEANAASKTISLHLNMKESLMAFCDEVSIHTVFRNIISNAIKFTPNEGSITIDGKVDDSLATVTIKDSGVGMSSNAISNIFEKNQHFTSSGTQNEQGTGLGLMLVKDFVKKNNGTIKVESEIGVGTTFIIQLPII